MKKLLTAIFAISITVPAFARTVTGTVVNENNAPMIGATVQLSSDKKVGTLTDTNGKFSLNNVSDDEIPLTVTYVGYKTQTVQYPSNKDMYNVSDVIIHMPPSSEMLDDAVLISGTKASIANAKKILRDQHTTKCVPTECESERYKLTGQKKATQTTAYSCTTEPDYQCDNNDAKCDQITIGDACEDQVGHDCTDQAGDHVRTATYEWDGNKLNCVIKKCDDHFMLDNDKKCVASDGPCTADQIAAIDHAKSGKLKNGQCHVTECDPGYEVLNDACVEISGKCKPLHRKAKSGTRAWDDKTQKEICIITECESGYSISDDKLSCQSKLSEADSRARVDELRENAKKMHDKETSTANKLIGAAGIGATGIGTSQALSALSEQRADDRAENDMRAYLATIKCDYGTGKTVNGGETGIELPGGNELTQYVTQYKTLAADLKVRKTALGMSPGIESETIIDAAETGLYDNAATGKTNGAFTSLSRALSDETSADAQAWAQQKADTASKLKTGAIVAGVGAVGSAIANLAVNSGADKQNKSDEILANYASKSTQKLQAVVDDVAQTIPQKKCSDFPGATGTFPNCQCSGNSYFKTDAGCIACDGERVVNADKTGCECPSNLPVEKDGQCIAKTPDCNLSGLKHSDKCECIANAHTASNNKCVCNTDYTETDGACTQNQPATTTLPNAITLNIDSDTFFDSGRATVKNEEQLIADLKGKTAELTESDWAELTYCVSVTGHTDRTRFRRRSGMNNQILSERRAKAVEQIMRQVFTMGTPKFQSSGKGASECTATKYKKPNDKDCRHVKIVITAGKCDNTNTDTITSALTAVAATVTGATSQTPEKVDTRTNEPTEQKVEKQETLTDTQATDTDSANTGETTVGTTNDVSNNTNAEKGDEKTDNPTESKKIDQQTQGTTIATPATGADSTNTDETTTTPSSDEKVSTPSDTSGNDENAKKFQALMTKLDAQEIPEVVKKAVPRYSNLTKLKENDYRPSSLTDSQIDLLSHALEVCTNDTGYLYLTQNGTKGYFDAECFNKDCIGTCRDINVGKVSSKNPQLDAKLADIKKNFTSPELILSKGHWINDNGQNLYTWYITFNKETN